MAGTYGRFHVIGLRQLSSSQAPTLTRLTRLSPNSQAAQSALPVLVPKLTRTKGRQRAEGSIGIALQLDDQCRWLI